jgi:hypothetical protein
VATGMFFDPAAHRRLRVTSCTSCSSLRSQRGLSCLQRPGWITIPPHDGEDRQEPSGPRSRRRVDPPKGAAEGARPAGSRATACGRPGGRRPARSAPRRRHSDSATAAGAVPPARGAISSTPKPSSRLSPRCSPSPRPLPTSSRRRLRRAHGRKALARHVHTLPWRAWPDS